MRNTYQLTISDEGEKLDVLVTLVEAYERDRWPIESLDPVSAIETAMTMNGYSRADFAALVGQSRATEVLGRKRALTLPMIRKIARLACARARLGTGISTARLIANE